MRSGSAGGRRQRFFLLSAATATALGLAALLSAGRSVRWIAPGWPVVVLMVVVLLSAPLPPGTYSRLTGGLQGFVTGGVVDTLRFFGIPALRAGNVIDLGGASVGVEEACSGVRSLVSCVLAGLVLSALLLQSPWRRVWLVGLAAPLALLTNFARSLALTLLARKGVVIAGAWHDGLGYAVLAVTTGLLGWLAFALEEKAAQGGARETRGVEAVPRRESPESVDAWRPVSLAALACLVAAAGWFTYVAARTQSGAAQEGRAPELERLIPAETRTGWQVQTRTDIARFAGVLQTQHLIERTYSKVDDRGQSMQVTVYAAWWPAGASSVSTVAMHTPEACWPGAGWQAVQGGPSRVVLRLGDGRTVAGVEKRAFRSRDYPQQVWFWHLVDGRPIQAFDPRSWKEQLSQFFERGVRGDEPQAFLRISSNVDWDRLAGDPLMAEVLAGFAELGVPLGVIAKK